MGRSPGVLLMSLVRFKVSALSVLVAFGCGGSPLQSTLQNSDYAFQVRAPMKAIICIPRSGGHPHGFGWNLDGTNCHQNTSHVGGRSLALWADYNSGFIPNVQAYLRFYCRQPRRVAGATLGIAGLETYYCKQRTPTGVVVVDVAAQRAVWDSNSSNPEDRTPYIYYHARLVTDDHHSKSDSLQFRELLASVTLTSLSRHFNDQ